VSVTKIQSAPASLIAGALLLYESAMRRCFIYISLGLLVGSVANMLVTMMCALVAKQGLHPCGRLTKDEVQNIRREYALPQLWAWRGAHERAEGLGYSSRRIVLWGMVYDEFHPMDPDLKLYFETTELQAGWPWPSLRHDRIEQRDSFPTVRQVRADLLDGTDVSWFPVQPIWRGVIGSTLFYGIVIICIIVLTNSLQKVGSRQVRHDQRSAQPDAIVAWMRRALIWMVLPVLAGVFINVLVIMLCVIIAQRWPGPSDGLTGKQSAMIRARFGMLDTELIGAVKNHFGYEQLRIGMSHRQAANDHFEPIGPDQDAYIRMTEVMAGWPFKACFQRMIRLDKSFLSVVEVHADMSRRIIRDSAPIRPMWLGFIINSIFYGLLVLVPVLFPKGIRVVRQCVRAQRGLCPACAYPIGVSDRCTECGAPVLALARREVQTDNE